MDNSIDLNALRVFERVAANGSFTAAARHFHVAVSSVSRQISALEASLGVQLLYRHTRAVSLTDAGRQYYERIRGTLEQLERATEALTEGGAEPSGTLRINAPVAFGQRRILPLLNDFQQRHPAIRAELLLSDEVTDPVREGSDITFRVGELADSSLVARPLAPMNYVTAASPAYLDRRGTPETPQALFDHDCLLYQGEMGRQRWYFRGAGEARATALGLAGSLYSNDAESLLHAALLGQGIVMFPTWLIGELLHEGRLVPLLEAWQCEVAPRRRMIHMLTTEGRQRTPKVQAFIDHLLAAVDPVPPWDRWRDAH
ncbi:LysR family transcriptional regulator [Kushneria sinocarnis]|uniref:LysR family transcriptional regulator n=1 Tax=Kushneria sinocarnis TaxID=595502 RepID=A0A420WWS0_9GAMM|nr:LysR family transcriptional regulator [Kushneria sinocarnis]RKR03533.1 LysR family transcriptional regulator [Kushneria sinocarnis]